VDRLARPYVKAYGRDDTELLVADARRPALRADLVVRL
jgi:hypothetical protein